MDNVYESASRVIAWLGEENEDSKLAFDAFEALPRDNQVHWDLRRSRTFDEKFIEPQYARAIENLFRRPWWHRIWTVQESVLGKILVFVCGYRQCPAELLFALELGHSKHKRSCCEGFFRKPASNLPLTKDTHAIAQLHLYRGRSFAWRLIHLLGEFRSRGCSDPRDKIYALLNLCNAKERRTIVPDYSLPVSSVYEQATLRLIENSRSLEVFGQLCTQPCDGLGLVARTLPSWVPNGKSEVGSGLTHLNYRQIVNIFFFDASAKSLATVKYLEKDWIAWGKGAIYLTSE